MNIHSSEDKPEVDLSHDFSIPLSSNLFSLEFSQTGSTILNNERFAMHARQILVDEENYLGLFALDMVLKNKAGQYRRDDITPTVNHLLHVFFTFKSARKSDAERGTQYLTDRPDLDLVLALLHDEGEDTEGFTKDFLEAELHRFIDDLPAYIEEHNKRFMFTRHDHYKGTLVPNPLKMPTPERIERLHADVEDIVEPFDLVTKRYKGQKKRESYYDYHCRILGKDAKTEKEKRWHARATRVKITDKACNGATFVHRSEEMLFSEDSLMARYRYRLWVNKQINKMRDIYQDQSFLNNNQQQQDEEEVEPYLILRDHFREASWYTKLKKIVKIILDKPETTEPEKEFPHHKPGFIHAAQELYPESAPYFSLMHRIIDTQLKIYSHDLANEEEGHESPSLNTFIPEYDKICLSPRIDLIRMLLTRLKEVKRLDDMGKERPAGRGMFGIAFRGEQETELEPITPHGSPTAFYSFFGGAPSPCS